MAKRDPAHAADMRPGGDCVYPKAKRIDVTVQGADGAKASGIYRQLLNR